MASFFGRHRKNTQSTPVTQNAQVNTNVGVAQPQPQPQTQPQPKPTMSDRAKERELIKEQREANKAMEEFSATKEEIIALFDAIEHDEDSVWEPLKNASQFNDLKRKAYNQQLQELKDKGDEYVINAKLVTLSEQAEKLLAGTDDVKGYPSLIHSLKNEFAQQSSTKGVLYEANELNKYVAGYLGNLKTAIRDGQKLKVSCCKDILLYILRVGYREESATDEGARKRILEKKVSILKNGGVCDQLLNAIDQCYKLFRDCETREDSYGKNMAELEKMFESLEDIPSDVMDKIGGLSFKYAQKNLSDESVQKVLPAIIRTASATSLIAVNNTKIVADVNELARLSVNIEELMLEFRIAYRTPYNEFDGDKFTKCIEEHRNTLANEIKEMQNFISAGLELDEKTNSLFNSVREDQRLAQNTASATYRIREQMQNSKKVNNYEQQVRENQRKREIREAEVKKRLKQEQEELEQKDIENDVIYNEPELLENE